MAGRRGKRVLGNVLTAVGAVVITLVVLEIVLRIALPYATPTTKYDPVYVYRFNPGATQAFFSPDVNRTVYHTYNKLGWLGPLSEYNVTTDKPHRMLVIGDSFASQLTLPDYNDIFSEQIEEQFPSWDVITIGVGSYAFDNEEKVFENEGDRYHPQVVVFATFINDLMDAYRDNVYSVEDGQLQDNTPQRIPLLKKLVFYCWDYSRLCGLGLSVAATVNGGLTANKVATAVGIADIQRDSSLHYRLWGLPDTLFLRNVTGAQRPQSVKDAFAKVDLILKRIKRISEERNQTVEFAMIPIREQISERKRAEFFAANPDLDPATYDFSKPYHDIKALIEANNFTVIDLEPGFAARNKDNDFYYEVDGHWNLQGHALAAELIVESLQRQGILPADD